jgi:hypothetical protein
LKEIMYIKTKPENVYPYELWRLREDYPGTSFPQPYERADLTDFNIYKVTPTPKPDYNPATEGLDDSASLVNGKWVQTWTKRPATQVEIDDFAEKSKQADDKAARTSAKADATIKYLMTHTDAEITAKIAADGTTLASLRGIVTRLAVAVGALYRRED